MERALGAEFNLIEDFFTEDDGVKDNKNEKKSKMRRAFTFQE
jgi:hypothetical protein